MDGVDEGDGIRCIAVSIRDVGITGSGKKTNMQPRCESSRETLLRLQCRSPTHDGQELVLGDSKRKRCTIVPSLVETPSYGNP